MLTTEGAQMGPSERRTTRRFDMHLPALVRISGDQFQKFVTETHNVSAGGIFFYVEGSITAETKIEVTLTLPSQIAMADDVRVRFTGRVVRVEKKGTEKIGVAAAIEEYEFLRAPQLQTIDSQIIA